MESKYYDQIMALPGAEEIKQVVNRWKTLSGNLGRVKPDSPVVLPDYLLLTQMGAGKSTVLQLLAGYLRDTGLMTFQGDTKVVEFRLENNPGEAGFAELGRLTTAISAAAGFRAEFRGIVAVDCTEWTNDFESGRMKALLNYLMENTHKWLIVLELDCDENSEHLEEKLDRIEAVVSSFLRINVLHLPHISTDEMADYVIAQIAEYGMTCAPGVKELLTKSLDVLREQKYFSGFHALEAMAEEIVYTLYSGGSEVPTELTAEMLPDFAADGAYIRQQVRLHRKLKTIGF